MEELYTTVSSNIGGSHKNTLVCIENLSSLMLGVETETPELDFLEITNSLLRLPCSICIGVNVDLLSQT